jgi:hypothetical protein
MDQGTSCMDLRALNAVFDAFIILVLWKNESVSCTWIPQLILLIMIFYSNVSTCLLFSRPSLNYYIFFLLNSELLHNLLSKGGKYK